MKNFPGLGSIWLGFILLSVVALVSAQRANRRYLNTDGARCLDGSYPAVYIRSNEESDKFAIFLEGGGWCGTYTDRIGNQCQPSCLEKSQGQYGTSDGQRSSRKLQGGIYGGFRSQWTHVNYRYCDGSSYSGDIDDPVMVTDPDTGSDTPLYFRGFSNLKALITELESNWDLAGATEVIIAGCSAGALGVYLHGDWMLNEIARIAPNLQRTGLVPDSGYFMEYQSEDRMYVSLMRWVFDHNNVSASFPPSCLNAYQSDPWKCIFAANVVPFIQSRLFPLQPRFDSWQKNCVLGSDDNGLINAFGKNLSDSITDVMLGDECDSLDNNGIWIESCSHHCGRWNDIIIDGYTVDEALQAWFYEDDSQINHSSYYFQERDYLCDECCQSSFNSDTPDLDCLTPEPTAEPISMQTLGPSANPFSLPSDYPSSNPISAPSSTPSTNPTTNPSSEPSKYPSNDPSMNPTELPTDIPSPNPNIQPTVLPVEIPSQSTEKVPTFFPIPSLNFGLESSTTANPRVNGIRGIDHSFVTCLMVTITVVILI